MAELIFHPGCDRGTFWLHDVGRKLPHPQNRKDELQRRSFRYSLGASLVTLPISIVVHVWVVARYPLVAQKWVTPPSCYHAPLFPLLAVFAFAMFFRSLQRRREIAPLLWNAAIILFSFISLSVSLYPDMIPTIILHPVTVEEAATSPKTLMFMSIVMAVLIPVILAYTGYTYRVFRGKVKGEGYGYEE